MPHRSCKSQEGVGRLMQYLFELSEKPSGLLISFIPVETLPVDLAVRERTTKACMHILCPLDACVHQDCLKVPAAKL